ncbi:MAG TPA: L-threonylcarbamoyladenylate synthase [Spirochaetia bacterium]|jgi:tRNA threonylcarbamoyl adenosine modification protein (Sua5/YciO/YrdC/YwlC family)|nr:L-threonylcarbamoyladenylate synthase [Spirochaetia bacterium]
MVAEIRPSNLDQRVLDRAAKTLESGGLVAFPTDSSWSVACDSRSKEGIGRLKKLKGTAAFTPTVLTDDLSQWNDFADLDNGSFRLVKRHVPGPYVFIFPVRPSLRNPFGLKRAEVGLRMPDHPVPRALVRTLGRPVFAITASRQLSEPGWWDEAFAQEYLFGSAWELEALGKEVELILDPGEDQSPLLTTVVDLTNPTPILVRQGIGPWVS